MGKPFSQLLDEVANVKKKKKVEDTIPSVSTGIADPATPMHIMNPTNTSSSLNGSVDDKNLTPFSKRMKNWRYRIDEGRYIKRTPRNPDLPALKLKPPKKEKPAVDATVDLHTPKKDDPDDAKGVITQMRKAKSLRGEFHVHFNDGSVMKNFNSQHAQQVMTHHDSLPTAIKKQEFVKKVGASSAAMKAHLRGAKTSATDFLAWRKRRNNPFSAQRTDEDIQGYDNAAIFNPPKMWDTTVKSSALATENHLAVGDKVHAGFGKKGGAGYRGTVHKVDPKGVHVNIGTGKFGPRIVIAPHKHVTKESATESIGPPYSQALTGLSMNPIDPTRQPTSHVIPTASLDVESSDNGKKNKQTIDRIKNMIMQLLNKKEG